MRGCVEEMESGKVGEAKGQKGKRQYEAGVSVIVAVCRSAVTIVKMLAATVQTAPTQSTYPKQLPPPPIF